jgi:spermidine synthase
MTWLKNNYFKIFLISFVFLFLELLVIRLVTTEIRIFAYMSNLVLLAIFSGSGLGMLVKQKFSLNKSMLFFFIISLVLVTKYIVRLPNLEFKLFSGITELLAPLSESHLWLQVDTFSKTGILIGLGLTVLLFLVIAFAFVPIGQYLGRALNQSQKPLVAYSVNVFASLIGMWFFQIFSFSGFSPYLGLFLGQLLLLVLLEEKEEKSRGIIYLIAIIVLLLPRTATQPYEQATTFWSPYQKLVLSPLWPKEGYQPTGWYLETNNVGYMALLDLSLQSIEKKWKAITEVIKPSEAEFANAYKLPYQFLPNTKEVLIIGGGGGNDAAAALNAGLKNITVVEIDPTIISLGKKYHPEQPYDHKEVKVYVDDGRAFLQRTSKKYDLVIMSLADSHTVSSSLTNLRLDNYLYTQESLQKIKELLSDKGILFLSFEVGRPWIGDRLQKTLTDVFSQKPLVFEVRSKGAFGWGGIMFVAAKNPSTLNSILKDNQPLAHYINNHKKQYNPNINALTDNWPYLYLDQPRLPIIHLLVAAITLVGLAFFGNRILKGKNFSLVFFFLGVAFMLFEFQNISKSGLIFGTTWTTNLFVISGVLIFILAANLSVAKKIISLQLGFFLLFTTLILQLLIPLKFFNNFSGIIKLIFSLAFLCLPHFFSGIIFASLFQQAKNKAVALGSNFLGSVVGGLLEMFSFLLGINALLYFVIAFYGLGGLFARKSR